MADTHLLPNLLAMEFMLPLSADRG